MQSTENPSRRFLVLHEVSATCGFWFLSPHTNFPVTFFPGAGKRALFCSLAFRCPGLPRGGFLPSLAMVPPQGLVLAAGVVGSEHNSLGTGEPAHGERRGIISAILTQRRGKKFLALPATRLISIGRLLPPRPAIHKGGAGPLRRGAADSPRGRPVTQSVAAARGQPQSERLQLRGGGWRGY